MATTQTLLQFPQQFFANDGSPLNGGTLTFYVGGSVNTLQNTYSDQALTVLNPNPISLNSAGFPVVSSTEVKIYPLAANYKIVVKDSGGATLHTWDNVEPNAPWNLGNGASFTNGSFVTPTITSPTINTSILSASALLAGICQGRLTLTSGAPVTTSDVTGATTIYFTPYLGNNIALYDGAAKWTLLPFSEISIALGTLTSGLPYDLFVFNNAGVVTLRAPVAWTSTTARATALTKQDGIFVKTGATTDRYVGTFYTTSTTQTEDSLLKRDLWNYYNRVTRLLRVVDATDSWTYGTHAWRQANGSAANQIECVIGVQEVAVRLEVKGLGQTAGSDGIFVVGIGEDVTNAIVTGELLQGFNGSTSAVSKAGVSASLIKYPAVGKHVYAWLENSLAGVTVTFYGDNGLTEIQTGLAGWIDG